MIDWYFFFDFESIYRLFLDHHCVFEFFRIELCGVVEDDRLLERILDFRLVLID